MLDELFDIINETAFEFVQRLVKALTNLKTTEALKLLSEINFYEELMKDKKFAKSLFALLKNYKDEINRVREMAESVGVEISSPKLKMFEKLIEIDANWITGSVRDYADIVKSTIIKSIIATQSYSEIVDKLKDIPILPQQKRALITTAYNSYRSVVLEKTFEKDKEVRFLYAGVLDEKTRDVCRNALLNQPKEGLTIEEIKNGALEGIDFYTLGGFNCRHYWEIAE